MRSFVFGCQLKSDEKIQHIKIITMDKKMIRIKKKLKEVEKNINKKESGIQTTNMNTKCKRKHRI